MKHFIIRNISLLLEQETEIGLSLGWVYPIKPSWLFGNVPGMVSHPVFKPLSNE